LRKALLGRELKEKTRMKKKSANGFKSEGEKKTARVDLGTKRQPVLMTKKFGKR